MALERVVITGAAGMLGSALLDLCPPGFEAVGVDLPDGDIAEPEGARAVIVPRRPASVIHCAAYTDVDGCSRDPETAFRINAEGTANVAAACRECGCYLIALSTDYVFDGEASRPYVESDAPNPLNAYGQSKLAGEMRARELHNKVLIVRTQWLYGPNGKNFVRTIVTRGRERGELRVVADECGSPTYTRDLAPRLWQLAALKPTGILHCTNSGVCSWADLARVALRAAGAGHVTVTDISWRDWQSPTRRPHYSPLGSQRLEEHGLSPLRPWQEAVEAYASAYLSEA